MIAAFLTYYIASSVCVPIECQDITDPYNRCIEVTDTIKVSSCPPTMYCPSYSSLSSYSQQDLQDVYCEDLPYNPLIDLCTDPGYQSTQVPGDECCRNSNCNSNICAGLRCQGLAAGSTCTDPSSCAPGLYCSSNLCVPCLPSGSSCASDLECKVGYGCNYGICTKLWSVDISQKAQNSKFCASGYLNREYCDLIWIYINKTERINAPFECNLVDTCGYYSYVTRDYIFQAPCTCSGTTNSTTGYCGSFINYVDGIYQSLYQTLSYTNSICSGPNAHTDDAYELWRCGSISSESYKQYTLQTKQNNFWALYKSGSINSCAGSATLFQISQSLYLLTKCALIFSLLL
jgi:hypothetical protein